MIKLFSKGAYLLDGKKLIDETLCDESSLNENMESADWNKETARENTMAFQILKNHNVGKKASQLKLRFDAIVSHDITYVNIIQTARACGIEKFPLPYILSNCQNSLCAVGGTINEDDHVFGLSAVKRYGGIFIPPHQAVIHQFMREMISGCGKMILGSDSHTRYGALGAMGIGEGGGELVKQLLSETYNMEMPQVICVYLTGKLKKGVGPHDVALALIGAVFDKGYVTNKVLEFVGDGVENLSVDFRNSIDVMTTETTCLSSIWITDHKVEEYYKIHGREDQYQKIKPGNLAFYDGAVYIDLSEIEPMIALPFHPSNVYKISELNENLEDILWKVEKQVKEEYPDTSFSLLDKIVDGKLQLQQGVVVGCAGGSYENICDVADILRGHNIGHDSYALSIYPASQPILKRLAETNMISSLIVSGATIRTAFCGPCFGAGDIPANNSLSIRHSTRNFPNREGSIPMQKQFSAVALMDARSIAATSLNGGKLTSAADIEYTSTKQEYYFDQDVYKGRCYNGVNHPNPKSELVYGPNIKDWMEIPEFPDSLLMKMATVIHDPVTTTDEIIPSGETSSYRSNPAKLAEFTFARRDPEYVSKAKHVQKLEEMRKDAKKQDSSYKEVELIFDKLHTIPGYEKIERKSLQIGSAVYATCPGDGSAREQAASCQKVLGGVANIVKKYGTRRYYANLINWGIVPFTLKEGCCENDEYIFVPNIKEAIKEDKTVIEAYRIGEDIKSMRLEMDVMSEEDKEILLSGGIINYYRKRNKDRRK